MASLGYEDPFEELNERAGRMGMEPKVFLAWLLDAEKREALLVLERSTWELSKGKGVPLNEVMAKVRQMIRDQFPED